MSPPDRARQICDAFNKDVPVAEIADMFGVQRPAIYKMLRRHGVLPAYKPAVVGKKTIGSYTERRQTEPGPDRTPCPRCGVRADYGCSHNRGAGHG